MSFRQSLTGLLFGLALGLLPLCASAQCVNLAIAGGTADALTVPSLPCTPTTTLLVLSTPQANQTSSPTLSVNGGAGQVILGQSGQALVAGSLPANGKVLLSYNGTNWFLLNPGVGAISGPGSATVGDLSAFNSITGKSIADSGIASSAVLQHFANNAALGAAAGPSLVIRDSFSTLGDSPPLAFQLSNSPCSIASGAGDGGSQTVALGGKCWLAIFPAGGLDARWWGSTYPLTMSVSSAGTDSAGASFCLVSACRSLTNALTQAMKFDVKGQAGTVNVAAGTFTEAEMVVNAALRGAAQVESTLLWEKGGAGAIHIIGAGSGSTTITTTTANCATFNANYGGVIYIEALTATYGGSCPGAAPFYTQFGGTILIGPDVAVSSGTGADGFLGEQGGRFIVNPGVGGATGLKASGTFSGNLVALGTGSLFQSDSTINFNGATFTGNPFYVTDGSQMKLDGNPAVSGTINGNTVPLFSASTFTTLNEFASITARLTLLFDNGGVWDNSGLSPAITVNGFSGVGSTGTVAVSAGATPYRGTITLSPSGSGIATLGNVTLNIPYQINNSACLVQASPLGTASWNGGNFNAGTAGGTTTLVTNWSNFGAPLVSGNTYKYNWSCR